MSQNVLVGTVDVGLGAQTYGGSSPTDYEEQATGSNGFGVRMTPTRVYHNWFTQAFTAAGRDETLFKSGHRVIFSISNMNKITSSFTFKTMWSTTTYDAAITAMFTRIAAMPFDAAVAGGSTYGGLTQAYVDIDLEHEIDRETPHPGVKLYPRPTKANPAPPTDTNIDYQKAYQKLWTIWQSVASGAGVSPTRVRFNWIITPYNLSTADRFYPGDQYVDIVSYDPYASSASQSFASLCSSLGVFTHARSHKKPIGFGEFMCIHTADSAALQQWFVDAATTINALTDIAVEYLCLWPAGPSVEGASYYTFNFNKVADTNSHAFPLAHAGILSMITAFGGNPIRTVVSQAKPASPTGLAGLSSVDGTQMALSWSANPGGDNASGWLLYRAPGWVGAGGSVIATLNTATPRTYTDTGLTQGGKYTYWVGCVNSAGNGPVSAPIQVQTQQPSSGSNPAITSSSAVATVGSQSVVFAAAATSPLGRPLTYNWSILNGLGAVIDTFSGASATRTYQTMGHYTYVLTVADNGTPALTATATDSFDLVLTDNVTPILGWNMDPFLPGRFVELHGQALLAIFGDQDTRLGGLLYSVGEAGELFGTVGQTFDPAYAGASSTADLASGKIIWAKLKCRSTTISQIGTITTQAQIGTGSKVAICDVNGNFLTTDGTNAGSLTIYSGTNVDAWLTHAAGDTPYTLDGAISGLTQGQDILVVVFSPSATVTQYAKFIATEAPLAAAVANGNTAIPIWGSATGQTDITNPPPFGSYAAINRPYFYINA